jgi:hypothetical protein
MTKSTFEIKTDAKSGLRYVTKAKDELTKNYRGTIRKKTAGIMPETVGSEFCQVRSFERYINKLHPSCDHLYWMPNLHKTPCKEMYIVGSSTCSSKELSIHLILSAVKEGQQKYCETVYSRSGIHHMWILKNSYILTIL